jgi:hypothetical protein
MILRIFHDILPLLYTFPHLIDAEDIYTTRCITLFQPCEFQRCVALPTVISVSLLTPHPRQLTPPATRITPHNVT